MMEGRPVAIYLDFENLAISADTVYPSREKPLLIEPIVDFAHAKGDIWIKKAYADWSRDFFAQYQNRLLEQGFDLVHLPETNAQGKNGADVRLAVDVMDYLSLFPDIGTIIIGSGDTDFVPLIQRLRARGKEVIVLGFEHSVGKLVKRNSAEFRSLEELIGEPEAESPSSDLAADPDRDYGRRLMLRYLRSRPDDGPVLMAKLKQQLLRLDSSFSEKEHGFTSFKLFVQSLEGDLIERIEMRDSTLPLVHFREEFSPAPAQQERNMWDQARHFLSRKLRYQAAAPLRREISQTLLGGFRQQGSMSMAQMFEYVHDKLPQSLPKTDIKKYINTLFTGGAFEAPEQKAYGPLLSRPFDLKAEVADPESLDQVYIQRISEILQSRYEDLKDQDILELLI